MAHVLATVLFALLLTYEARHCYKSGHANPDTLDYVSMAESDHANLILKAEQECLDQISPEVSGCLYIRDVDYFYPQMIRFNEQQLHQVLRLYRVKPLFNFVLRQLVLHTRMDGMQAIRTVCGWSYFAVGVLLWLWLREYMTPVAASCSAALMLTFSQMMRMGQMLTPDVMACALFMLALYLVIYQRWMIAGLTVTVLLLLTRRENVVLVMVFGVAWLAWSGMTLRRKLLWSLALVAGAVALQTVVGHYTHPVGWQPFFRSSFFRPLPPEQLDTARISVRDYLHIMATIGVNAAGQFFPLQIFLAAIALLNPRCPLEMRRLLYVCAVVAAIRFLLYPTLDERFYTPFLLVTFVAAAVTAVRSLPPALDWLGRPAPAVAA